MLHHLDIHVVDVKNAFLQAEMKEEEMIYVTQPEGYVDSDHPDWVCLLLKSLYGIKQSVEHIESNFNQSDADPCVNTRLNKTIKTLMTVYVDDLTLIGRSHDISKMKKLLASRFPITDLGPANPILGVEVIRDFKGGTTTLC